MYSRLEKNVKHSREWLILCVRACVWRKCYYYYCKYVVLARQPCRRDRTTTNAYHTSNDGAEPRREKRVKSTRDRPEVAASVVYFERTDASFYFGGNARNRDIWNFWTRVRGPPDKRRRRDAGRRVAYRNSRNARRGLTIFIFSARARDRSTAGSRAKQVYLVRCCDYGTVELYSRNSCIAHAKAPAATTRSKETSSLSAARPRGDSRAGGSRNRTPRRADGQSGVCGRYRSEPDLGRVSERIFVFPLCRLGLRPHAGCGGGDRGSVRVALGIPHYNHHHHHHHRYLLL